MRRTSTRADGIAQERWTLGTSVDAAQRVTEALADYATVETNALVRRGELARFAVEVERLRAALDDLERRLA